MVKNVLKLYFIVEVYAKEINVKGLNCYSNVVISLHVIIFTAKVFSTRPYITMRLFSTCFFNLPPNQRLIMQIKKLFCFLNTLIVIFRASGVCGDDGSKILSAKLRANNAENFRISESAREIIEFISCFRKQCTCILCLRQKMFIKIGRTKSPLPRLL